MTEASPSPAAADPRRWGLGEVVLGYLVVLVFSQLWAAIVVGVWGYGDAPFDELPLSVVAVAQLGLSLAFLAVPWAVTRTKGQGLVSDLGFRARWEDLWKGGLLGALLQYPVIPLLYWPLLSLLGKSPSDLDEPAQSLGDRAAGVGGAVLLILIVGVLAPVFEELFFRGFVQQALLKRGLSPAVSIGITAVFFGLTHFQLLQLPGLVLAGALFGVLAHRSGRLGPAIAAHLTFNMVTVVALLAA